MENTPPQEARSGWAVACTCREPLPLVVAFVAHYLALGARAVHLYLDAPDAEMQAVLAEIKAVDVIVCDADHWQNNIGKRRSDNHRHRQLANVFHAYQRTPAAWLLHVDADEFIHSEVPLSHQIAALPDEVDTILFEPRERVYVQGEDPQNIFDGHFRAPTPRAWERSRALHGHGRYFLRGGLLGHPHGKSMTRTGMHIIPGIHSPRRTKSSQDIPLRTWHARRAWLLHFDGLTPLHWSLKLLRAVESGDAALCAQTNDIHRARQMMHVARAGASYEDARALHDRLKCLSTQQAAQLDALGLLFDYDFDPARAIARAAPHVKIDLSCAAFDRAIVQEGAENKRAAKELAGQAA